MCLFGVVYRDRVVKTPYDTISQGSAASSNMPFVSGAFYQGDMLFDPAAAIAALQLGGGGGMGGTKKAATSAAAPFDTASLRSQDETIRYVSKAQLTAFVLMWLCLI